MPGLAGGRSSGEGRGVHEGRQRVTKAARKLHCPTEASAEGNACGVCAIVLLAVDPPIRFRMRGAIAGAARSARERPVAIGNDWRGQNAVMVVLWRGTRRWLSSAAERRVRWGRVRRRWSDAVVDLRAVRAPPLQWRLTSATVNCGQTPWRGAAGSARDRPVANGNDWRGQNSVMLVWWRGTRWWWSDAVVHLRAVRAPPLQRPRRPGVNKKGGVGGSARLGHEN